MASIAYPKKIIHLQNEKKIKHMKRIIYFLLLSFTLCSCNIYDKKIYEVDNDLTELDLTNYSLYCYNEERKEGVIINDPFVRDAINNGMKNSVAYRRDYFIKVPAYYGSFTFFTKGDTVKYNIQGNLLTRNKEVYYACDVNFQELLDSLVFKRDSIPEIER